MNVPAGFIFIRACSVGCCAAGIKIEILLYFQIMKVLNISD